MSLATGPITQVCWVIPDIGAAERFHSDHFGAGPWTRIPDVHFGPDSSVLRGEPADFVVHVSLAYIGELQLELIQPVRGHSIYSEFLARSGPGLHHICLETEDIQAAMAAARDQGLDVVQHGVMAGGLMSYAYVDGAAAGAPYIELAELTDDMRAFYAAVKDKGAPA